MSVVSKDFLLNKYPRKQIRPISELIGDSSLDLQAANGTEFPFVGWVEIDFKLHDLNNNSCHVATPFLVAQKHIDLPIIGFNIIEELVNQNGTDVNILNSVLSSSFSGNANKNVTGLINFIQSTVQTELCDLKTVKQDVIIPKNQAITVTCRANTGNIDTDMPAMFEPEVNGTIPPGLDTHDTIVNLKRGKSCRVEIEVRNNTKHDIFLKGRTLLGKLHLVRSVTPVEVKLAEEKNSCEANGVRADNNSANLTTVSEISRLDCNEQPVLTGSLSEIDLGDLTEQQKSLATKMLIEEKESFSKDDTDIGCIPELQMNIHLTTNDPVNRGYSRIPRPLYAEVKNYIEDLLNKGWIRQSRSSFSSPVVCVRKKDGDLRLCVDFRELNKKTFSDRHPLP